MSESTQEWTAIKPRLGELTAGEDAHFTLVASLFPLTIEGARKLLASFRSNTMADYDAQVEKSVLGSAGSVVESKSVRKLASERARLFGEHVARLAAESEPVMTYRKRAFGNPRATLSSAVARDFLDSPALFVMSLAEVRSRKIPLGRQSLAVTVPARPGGTRVVLPGRDHWEYAAQGSFVYDLAMSARFIGQLYGWSEPDAITFLLQGEAPAVDSLSVETARTINVDGQLAQAWITVRAMPHVRPEEVTAAFREAQGELNSRVRKPITSRNLTLLEFVAGETSHGATHDWPRLRKRWNARYGRKWHFTYASRMKSDFEATSRRVYMQDLARHDQKPRAKKRRGAGRGRTR